MHDYSPYDPSFFERTPLEVAPELLGAVLVHDAPDGRRRVGRIVETEAYTHDDPAFHAWGVVDPPSGLVVPSARSHDLFAPPGRSYVYLCYGMYWMLNVVTEPEGHASCVLIRALEPLEGTDLMWDGRAAARRERDLTNGPGKLTQAMDIDKRHHRIDLTAPPLYLAPAPALEPYEVETSSRIGITRAVDRPWRYFVRGNPYVSPGTPSDIAAERRRARRKRTRRF